MAAIEQRLADYFFFDGDQNRYPFNLDNHQKLATVLKSDNLIQFTAENGKIQSDKIPLEYNSYLGDVICAMTGCQKIGLSPDGKDGDANSEQRIKMERTFIDYWAKFVFFLPNQTPELAICEEMRILQDGEDSISNITTPQMAKDYFCEMAQKAYGTTILTNEIFEVQRQTVAKLTQDGELFKCIDSFLTTILS